MGVWNETFVFMLGPSLDEAGSEVFLEELERSIVERGPGKWTTLMTSGTSNGASGANHYARRIAEILNRHRDFLSENAAGLVYVTDSLVTRVTLRVIYTLAPPPYPRLVTKSLDEALGWLAEHGNGIEPVSFRQAWDEAQTAIGITAPVA